jgi:uncharacterized integral membrane protein (TIGR00698 family)
MNKMMVPGLVMASAIAGFGYLIRDVFNSVTGGAIDFGPEMWALLTGIAMAGFLSRKGELAPGFTFTEKKVLGWAIALMGLKLSLSPILKVGPILLPFLLVMMGIVIYLGLVLAKRFGLNPKAGLLIGIGNAICGASAIAAASPLIRGKARHTAMAVSVVYFLGTIGMLFIPIVLSSSIMPQPDKGLIAGGGLQAVGQAVAAGFAMGSEAGEWATLVKLFRISMLGPILLVLSLAVGRMPGATKSKLNLPGFVWAFFILATLVYFVDLPADILKIAKITEKFFLAMAMGAIGAGIKVRELMKQAPAALKLGTALFVVQLVLIISFILAKNYLIGS